MSKFILSTKNITRHKRSSFKAAFALENYENITIWAACERNEARALRQFF